MMWFMQKLTVSGTVGRLFFSLLLFLILFYLLLDAVLVSGVAWEYNMKHDSTNEHSAKPLSNYLLPILRPKQPNHLRPRQRNIPNRRARPHRRPLIIQQLDPPNRTPRDLQYRTAQELLPGNQPQHSIHHLPHRNPLALSHPTLTLRPERRQHTPRGYCDDAHVLGWFEGRHGFDEVVQTRFGGGVERDGRAGLLGCGAGEHEDFSGAGEARESVEGQLGAADGVVEVEFEDFVGRGWACGVGAGFEGPEVCGGLG